MIEHNHIDELINKFFEGKTTSGEENELKGWIKSDPQNRRYFQQAKNIWHVTYPAFSPEDIQLDEAEQKIHRSIRQNQHHSDHTLWFYWQRIAGILLLPLMILSIYLLIPDKESQPEIPAYQQVIAPYGMISKVTLPDSSEVWLNGGSSLKYPVRFEPGKRNVELRGEGYFEVVSDIKNPFIVQTIHSRLVATGTEFNINAHPSDTLTAITLANGTIEVQFANNLPFRMKPGDHAKFNDRNPRTYSLQQTDPYKWYAWKDGMMIFRDDPLEYVFKRLEQSFNVHINIKEPGISDALYRATFEGESLDEILRLLELTAPIKFVYLKRIVSEDNKYEKQQIEVRNRY